MSYDRSYTGPPWTLHCAHCDWSVIVHNRGAHGGYPGAGVEAAKLMEEHVERLHPGVLSRAENGQTRGDE